MVTYARAGAIIEKDGSYLFMKRNKQGHTYYAVLGGHPEHGESPAQTAVREIKEETGLTITVGDIMCTAQEFDRPLQGIYYWATSVEGTPELGGPEAGYTCVTNSYELAWIKKDDISKITLYPIEVHQYLMKLNLKDQ